MWLVGYAAAFVVVGMIVFSLMRAIGVI